jgi:hypothetical protein
MNSSPQEPTPMRIVDVRMPFGSMVVFMVKWSIAAIPAVIILAVLGVFVVALLGGIAGVGVHR